jgi:hypothetical protein
MGANQLVLCNACKTEPATTFIHGTLEVVGQGTYRVKCLSTALCSTCAALADHATDNGTHLAEALTGGKR